MDLLHEVGAYGALPKCADGVKEPELASCTVNVRAKTAATRNAIFVRFM
jgi:hypothetical protein